MTIHHLKKTAMASISRTHAEPVIDHRVQVAARKRAATRMRILEATIKVFAAAGGRVPVIEDVVKVAGVSRGSFYLHFQSLEEALHALSQAQSDQMTRDILPVYDHLKEPWERFSVGFRIFLKRAQTDAIWASFVTRSNTASDQLLVTSYMRKDLRLGLDKGQFSFKNLNVAVDFMMGASIAGISALGIGVSEPESYIDEAVRMALTGLGCSTRQCDRGVSFSRKYLEEWQTAHSDSAFSPTSEIE